MFGLPRLVDLNQSPQQRRRERGVDELRRWATALGVLSSASGPTLRAMLGLLGQRPYVFEKNVSRWSDGLFHLVDRGYQEIGEVALTEEQVVATGLKRWNDSRWCRLAFVPGCYAVMDDLFVLRAKHSGARALAGVLWEIVRELEVEPVQVRAKE